MRKIKFRAWEKNLKEIIPVHSIDFDNKIINSLCAWRFFDEIELMEFTGLVDKYGIEIYEGYIVEMVMPSVAYVIQGNGWLDTETSEGFTCKGTVRFLYSTWFIDEGQGKGVPLEFDEKQQIKVIGNVYENPELLEAPSK